MSAITIEGIADCQVVTTDYLFLALAETLEGCSEGRSGNCTECRNLTRCRKLFDEAADLSSLRRLNTKDYQYFYVRYLDILNNGYNK